MLNMFRAVVTPIASRNACLIVRTYRRAGNNKPRFQAGMRIQQQILGNPESLELDPELTYDADFNQLDVAYDLHENELAARKQQLKYFVVKNKYFKSKKMPNFLTWSEKEQIRYLNKQDPNEWTPERLAESFPAVEEVIVKILKANWTPANMKRIQRHDETVKQNWELFKSNEIKDLDPEVSEHLKKFSNRNFDSIKNAYVQTTNEQIEFKFPKPQSKEFSEIITSCKRKDTPKQLNDEDAKKQIGTETKLLTNEKDVKQLKLPEGKRKEIMTFDELMETTSAPSIIENEEMHLSLASPKDKNLISKDIRSDEVNTNIEGDTDVVNDIEESQGDEHIELTLTDVHSSKIVQKYAVKTGSLANLSKISTIPFQHKIKIPSHLRKRGSVYKFYDCFYDDRGIFMYRVPGLTN